MSLNTKSTLAAAAECYIDLGLSVVLCKDKRPSGSHWKDVQLSPPSPERLKDMLEATCDQIGIVAGSGSEGLEIIDVDTKYAEDRPLWEDLQSAIQQHLDADMLHMPIVQTISGGYHLYYRCSDDILGNLKLAARPDHKVLIETRGQGGYVIAPPSEGYTLISGSLENIPVIDGETRDTLHDICRMFNEHIVENKSKGSGKINKSHTYEITPWDEFDDRGDWQAIMQKHGWTMQFSKGQKEYWKRPGQSDTKQSGNFDYEHNCFVCHSSSTIFTPEKGYRPSAIYSMLEHNGDFTKGTIGLLEMGYGKRLSEEKMELVSKASEMFLNDKGLLDIRAMLEAELVGDEEEDQSIDVADSIDITSVDIRELRTGLKMSQADMAEAMGVSRVYVSNIENGKKNLLEAHLVSIWDYLFSAEVKFLREWAVTNLKCNQVLQDSENVVTDILGQDKTIKKDVTNGCQNVTDRAGHVTNFLLVTSRLRCQELASSDRNHVVTFDQFLVTLDTKIPRIASILTVNSAEDNLVISPTGAKMTSKSKEKVDKAMDEVLPRAKSSKGPFWYKNSKGKPVIDHEKFGQFLKKRGYRQLKTNTYQDSSAYVHLDLKNHIITECGERYIKYDLYKSLEELDFSNFDVYESDVKNAIRIYPDARWKSIFTLLPFINYNDIDICGDTKEAGYIPYKNAVIKITSDSVRPVRYHDLPQNFYVWRNQIRDRSVNLLNLDHDQERNKIDYYRFIKRLAGFTPEYDDTSENAIKEHAPDKYKRLMSFFTQIGYMLHSYKDPVNPISIVICEDTAKDGQGGGTGKGLLYKGVAKIKSLCYISGKALKTDTQFIWQKLNIQNQLVCIDDVRKNFDIEAMYNVITEAVDIERKNKDVIEIPFSQSPKFIFITNYDIGEEKEHSKRRLRKLLVHKYFDSSHRPVDEFGKAFFVDWNDDEWNDFDNTMFWCLQQFLRHGIVHVKDTINLIRKSITMRYMEEFLHFMDRFMCNMKREPTAKTHKQIYNEFLESAGFTERDYSAKRFAWGLKFYCEKHHIKFEKKRSKDRIGDIPRDALAFNFIFDNSSIIQNLGPDMTEIPYSVPVSQIQENDDLPF